MQQEPVLQTSFNEEQKDVLSQKQIKAYKKYSTKQRCLQSDGLFSFIFFSWISPLLTYGNQVTIDQKAIPSLPEKDKAKIQFEHLYQTFINTSTHKRGGMRLTKAIFKSYRRQFVWIFLIAVFYTGLQIGQPILTNIIISYIQSEERQLKKGIIYFLSIFVITIGMSLLVSQLYYKFAILGFNLSNTLSLLIYNKTLKHPLMTEKQFSTGAIINYSQVDAQRMTYLGFQLMGILLAPIQIIVMMFLLYLYIGVIFLVGVGVMILMMLFTLVFTKISVNANDQLLKKKDARMKLSEQILQIIKYIKVNALEKYLFRKLNRKRNQELEYIKKVQLYNVLTIFVYWLCPSLIISMTFLVYTAVGNQISADLAFTVIMLFNILQYPIRLLPSSISQVIQIWSSVKRMQHYLISIQLSNKTIEYNECKDQENAIIISKGNFFWGKQKDKQEENKNKQKQKHEEKTIPSQNKMSEESSEDLLKESLLSDKVEEQQAKTNQTGYQQALKDINIKFKAGKITMIIGDIGSGKSSILYSILNQMTSFDVLYPTVKVYGSIAFCPQKPWIMSGTIKQNIIFNSPFNSQKFDEAIYYSCLTDDLKILAQGIETQIGEKGINLSGGQKARVSLARALYSSRQIYLLDDILSAVDVHVGKFIMDNTISQYLKNKTVIMPTHAIHYLDRADDIVIMKKGRIVDHGVYSQIQQSEEYIEIKKLEEVRKQGKKQKDDQNVLLEQKKINQELKNIKKGDSQQKIIQDETDKIVQQLIIPEDKKIGKVSFQVYKLYFNLNGGWIFLIGVIGSISIWAVLSILANIQIQHWCEDSQNSDYHILWYLGFSIVANFFTATRAMILVMSGIRQGKILHKKMSKSLLYASIVKFYNRVPIGRVLNRLSKDLRQVDEEIGYAVGNMLVNFFRLFSGLIICLYASTPFIAIPCILIGFICLRLSEYYLKSQRQCVRLQNISSSPIVSGFTSAVNGVTTIRAYGVSQKFLASQFQKIDINKRNRVTREALQSWYSVRLALLSFIINMSAIAYCIFAEDGSGSLAGLLLAYSLSTNQDLVDTIFSYTYLETKMIAIERVDTFTKIEAQTGYIQYCKDWWTKDQGFDRHTIAQGNIQFKNFSVRYRKNLPIVLNNINLSIKAGEKIGIAGRTGAGKSTLLSCLLRILDHTEGSLEIDGKNIFDYKLKDLRSCMTMIDQDPTLIQGSFRENLDSTFQYTDQEIHAILKQCTLDTLVKEKGGLDAKVTNENLSVGQKQLLCICRALLKQTKIVLVDEATANIDVKTDQAIQDVIQTKFKDSTVLTIAHRLSTIKNCDKILVLGNGKILEWGNTTTLLKQQKSIFRKMCQESDQSYLQ